MPSQDSLTDQMRRTLTRAVAAGDYDAADWIRAAWANASRANASRPSAEAARLNAQRRGRELQQQPPRPSPEEDQAGCERCHGDQSLCTRRECEK